MSDRIRKADVPDDGVADDQGSGGEERSGFLVHSSVRGDRSSSGGGGGGGGG